MKHLDSIETSSSSLAMTLSSLSIVLNALKLRKAMIINHLRLVDKKTGRSIQCIYKCTYR